MPIMIDFDDIEAWTPQLSEVLQRYLPINYSQVIHAAKPDSVEDARDCLFKIADRDEIIDSVIEWIGAVRLAGYHGSRLNEAERGIIQAEGLRPLIATERRQKLIEKLSHHPDWEEVSPRLDSVIDSLGPKRKAGRREGQVHATLSRNGLTSSFNHYLTHGSEFDQRVAVELFNSSDGKALLSNYGEPTLIQLAIPGKIALHAGHVHFGIDDLRRRGDVPNIVAEFLEVWSYRVIHPEFTPVDLGTDCGMIFHSAIPSEWITRIDVLENFRDGDMLSVIPPTSE